METLVAGAESVLASAYIHAATGTMVLVLINLGSSGQTVVVQPPALPPGIQAFRVWKSDRQTHWQASVSTVDHGHASLILPGYGIATLVGTGDVMAAEALGPSSRAVQPAGVAKEPQGACTTFRAAAERYRRQLALGTAVLLAGVVAYLFRRRRS